MEVMDSGEGASHNVQVSVCLSMVTHACLHYKLVNS